MMCSIEELGSSREMYPDAPESGIYILPDDCEVGADAVEILGPVSYTHLDVYKRQALDIGQTKGDSSSKSPFVSFHCSQRQFLPFLRIIYSRFA